MTQIPSAGGGALAGDAWVLTRQGGSQFVTATCATVWESVSLSGTVMPQQQADVNFMTGGTVATVAVAADQAVTAGETLATLDTAPLEFLVQANVQLKPAQGAASLAPIDAIRSD